MVPFFLNYKKRIVFLIICSSLLRMAVAGSLELGNDEAYYQTYAQHLQWNYFDHPPMVALLIRLTTFNLSHAHEFFIRLGAIICAAAGTWLIFKIGFQLKNEHTGWIAALLYTASFYTSVIAGIFILPDSPQVIFWLLAMYYMICILDENITVPKQSLYFIFMGISTGLCIMSKLHGVFLFFGFLAYIIFHRIDLLKSTMLWISVIIIILIISPIFFWNLGNHFITYTYHQGRIGFWGNRPDMGHLLQQVLGSVFYNNPVNFVIYIFTVYALIKRTFKNPPKAYPLLLWLSIPLITCLVLISFFNETLPHWSGPAYLSLMLLSACWMEERLPARITSWLKTAISVFVVVALIGTLSIRFLPFAIGSRERKYLGKGDITLDMSGWKLFAAHFDSLVQSDLHSGMMKPGAVIISDYWFPAAHLDFYIGVPFHHNLLVFGNLNDIHHFAWLNQRRSRLTRGSDAYFIYPTNEYGPPKQKLKNEFVQVEDSILIPQFRTGIMVRYFVIYRMHNFQGDSSDYLIQGMPVTRSLPVYLNSCTKEIPNELF